MSCPLCSGPGRPAFAAPDRGRGIDPDRVFHYLRCAHCAALWLADPPDDLARHYPPSYYAGAAAEATEHAKLEFVHAHAPAGELVEVGPGGGGFARAAAAAGWRVRGIEMDAGAAWRLRESGIETVQSAAPELSLRDFEDVSAIAMWHVLEHLHEPWACVDAAAAALAPGGVLIVATPNPGALQLKLLRGRWPHLDAPRHLVLIPPAALLGHLQELELLELSFADRTGRDWNAFGWAQALEPLSDARIGFKLGAGVALALAPVERTGTRGSTYTAVLRKR